MHRAPLDCAVLCGVEVNRRAARKPAAVELRNFQKELQLLRVRSLLSADFPSAFT